eukprot:TRINITY_DN2618_c0_g1_i1.p1 TRINITY_DN2618_c0_g1~~TRINITY_DN2618_c0_g1_i1.p1  ORF type:complete len:179 (+),score=25.64 TRINITY_DN2618_c0_g1_i1:59-538(+)
MPSFSERLARVQWVKVIALIVATGVALLCASHYVLRGRKGGDLFVVGLPTFPQFTFSGFEKGDDEADPTPTSTLMHTETAYATVTLMEWDTVTLPLRYTTRGCRCAQSWEYKGHICDTMCCNFDNDPRGAWCAVEDPKACEKKTGSARTWGYCAKPGDP